MTRIKQTVWKSQNEKISWKQLSFLASHDEKNNDEKNKKKFQENY